MSDPDKPEDDEDFCPTVEQILAHEDAVKSIVQMAIQFTDDPAGVAALIADALTLQLGFNNLPLDPYIVRAKESYIRVLKAAAYVDGHSSKLQ